MYSFVTALSEISEFFKAQLEQTRALHQAQLQALHEQRRRERRRRRERMQQKAAKQAEKLQRRQEIGKTAGMQIVQVDANDNVLVQQSRRSKTKGSGITIVQNLNLPIQYVAIKDWPRFANISPK